MLSEKPWKLDGLLRVCAGIFVCLSVVSLLQMAGEHFAGKQAFADGTLPYLLLSSLALHGSILLATGIFLWLHRISWGEAFGFSTPPLGRAMMIGDRKSVV